MDLIQDIAHLLINHGIETAKARRIANKIAYLRNNAVTPVEEEDQDDLRTMARSQKIEEQKEGGWPYSRKD